MDSGKDLVSSLQQTTLMLVSPNLFSLQGALLFLNGDLKSYST